MQSLCPIFCPSFLEEVPSLPNLRIMPHAREERLLLNPLTLEGGGTALAIKQLSESRGFYE
jgi:hypothetical protein